MVMAMLITPKKILTQKPNLINKLEGSISDLNSHMEILQFLEKQKQNKKDLINSIQRRQANIKIETLSQNREYNESKRDTKLLLEFLEQQRDENSLGFSYLKNIPSKPKQTIRPPTIITLHKNPNENFASETVIKAHTQFQNEENLDPSTPYIPALQVNPPEKFDTLSYTNGLAHSLNNFDVLPYANDLVYPSFSPTIFNAAPTTISDQSHPELSNILSSLPNKNASDDTNLGNDTKNLVTSISNCITMNGCLSSLSFLIATGVLGVLGIPLIFGKRKRRETEELIELENKIKELVYQFNSNSTHSESNPNIKQQQLREINNLFSILYSNAIPYRQNQKYIGENIKNLELHSSELLVKILYSLSNIESNGNILNKNNSKQYYKDIITDLITKPNEIEITKQSVLSKIPNFYPTLYSNNNFDIPLKGLYEQSIRPVNLQKDENALKVYDSVNILEILQGSKKIEPENDPNTFPDSELLLKSYLNALKKRPSISSILFEPQFTRLNTKPKFSLESIQSIIEERNKNRQGIKSILEQIPL